MRTVIVGGVAGGATTAARLRRVSEEMEILILERGGHISYANCGLPYYIGETIAEREKLFVQTPQNFKASFNIDVRVHNEVLSVDRKSKRVEVRNLKSGEVYTEAYDYLVLSPGAEPVKPPIPGIQDPAIFTLRSVPETDAIKSYVDERHPKRAVVIGAGFIGLEMAENLHHRGIRVTIVEMASQVMNVVDYDMAALVHQHLKTKDIEFYLKDGVASFDRQGESLEVTLQSGRTIATDMVILSIGVRPEGKLAREAGLQIGETGGIKVDSYLRTTDDSIFALGDAVEFEHPITGAPTITYLAGPANKQGRICANNIAFGPSSEYRGAIGTAAAKVFDLTVATTGASEKQLDRAQMKYKTVMTHSSSHAGYYPGALPITIKTLFDPQSGRLFGAQAVGYDGVDKRIDLMATVVRSGGTIFDLTEIEHAYAPPYSSAKDPVNIAGFVAENVFSGRSRHVHWQDVMGCNFDEIMLLDVRTPQEYALGTIEGAVNIPTYELRERLDEVPRDRTIIVFCGIGLRAYHSEQVLRHNGYPDVFNLSGGYKTYELATQKQSNEGLWAGDYVGKDDNIYQSAGGSSATKTIMDEPRAGEPNTVGDQTVQLDATGLQCPGPIMQLKKEMDRLPAGATVEERATDPGFGRDVASWCRMTGNHLLQVESDAGVTRAVIRKGSAPHATAGGRAGDQAAAINGSTFIIFSDDMDRALASLVLANGAASSGKDVTLFFTFWGLSVIKKDHKPRVRKDLMGRMFAAMLPASTHKLKLSKMNFGGMGPRMMKSRMKSQNVDTIEQMLANAIDAGVRLVACQMSMDVMGVKAEELIEEVEIGGVATYMEAASESNVNLFI